MSGVPQWLVYVVLGVVVVGVVVTRQLREREFTPRQALVLPAIFLVLAFTDHRLGHDLASAGAVALFGVGLLLAVATGAARAVTMRVHQVGTRVLVTGNGRTLALWFVTLAVRVGEVAVAAALGIHEGTGEAMLFAAATFAAQGLVLARRAGLVGGTARNGEPVGERVG